jgi:hypothetical protein
MEDDGLFYSHLVYFTAIWHILWPFYIFFVLWYIFPLLVYCKKKDLATLLESSDVAQKVEKCDCYVRRIGKSEFTNKFLMPTSCIKVCLHEQWFLCRSVHIMWTFSIAYLDKRRGEQRAPRGEFKSLLGSGLCFKMKRSFQRLLGTSSNWIKM